MPTSAVPWPGKSCRSSSSNPPMPGVRSADSISSLWQSVCSLPDASRNRCARSPMWFLGAVVTFGVAFFPMFYRLVDGRNRHFQKEAEFEGQITDYLKSKGKEPPASNRRLGEMNAKAWAASIILVVPIFVILYLLS